jgi:hypothetical protein
MATLPLPPRTASRLRALLAPALLAGAALCGNANAELRLEIPGETFGPPFYARIEFASVDPGIVPNNGEWAAIVIYRQLDCIPGDFNLLEVFDVPRAFNCPLNDIGGYEVWSNAPGVDPAPAYSRLIGLSSVPVLFVRHAEFVEAIADDMLTMPELLALPSARMGSAEHFNELLRPSQSNAEPLLHITAHGRFEDGRGFRLRWTLSREPGIDSNASRTRIELIGADAPLGATLQPFPFGGFWFDPATPGQGMKLLPVPGEDRIAGFWNAYADGEPMWYLIDTGVDGFDGLRATFAVSRSSGGALNQAQPFDLQPIGELRIDFADCSSAHAHFQLGDASGSMELQMLLPAEACTD